MASKLTASDRQQADGLKPETVVLSAPDETALRQEAERRLKEAELLLSVSRRVAGIDKLDDVLETIVEMVTLEIGAERGTLFLNDASSGELYSRVAQGNFQREIRILNSTGIAGHVFTENSGIIIHDAYSDPRFNRTIDERTGFKTNSICCAPVRTVKGEIIGVVQCLNKQNGQFSEHDLTLLEGITTQAAVALQSTQFVETVKKSREQEMKFLDMVSDITSELELGVLLSRVMEEATRMLNADRSTLFLNDEKTNELFSRVAMGDSLGEIRLPNHVGIAGAVFTSGETINIPHAYADLRFNPAFDKKTGYFTRSILCVPVVNKAGKMIGVTQVLNKTGGPFTAEDETRLKAFTAQVSIALENAKLFEDVQTIKNYNESMLQSMSNSVITVDEEGVIKTCNAAGLKLFGLEDGGPAGAEPDLIGQKAEDFFTGANAWINDRLERLADTQEEQLLVDQVLAIGDERSSVNAQFQPLTNSEGQRLGSMIMVEDITAETRMKSTMSRYMDPGLADQLMQGGEDILGGRALEATVLFSDVRSFTTISEKLGPQGTVSMLNEYFTIMVDCIGREDGMLDKFIGDAIMAGFGIPLPQEDNADRGLRTAISMLRELAAWNDEREERGEMRIEMGIGLNTDEVVSGNIGSPKRMDYTMIGDGVNLAARLESACKQYSAKLLISGFTHEKLKGTYRMRDVDKVIVKGKTEPVAVYEVLDFHTEETFPNMMEAIGHFRTAREFYDKGEWDKAIKAFKDDLKIHPGDALAETYIGRCEQLKADPPEDWNGVWVMTSK